MNRILSIVLWALPPIILVVIGVTAYLTRDRWEAWLPGSAAESSQEESADPHAGHNHGAPVDAIVLSKEARKNLGLSIGTITTGEYWQKLPMPGEVVEIPGRSDLVLTSRVAGVIDEVFALSGQAVRPGDPLFTIRITGDDVIAGQSAMVNAIQQMKINQAEIDRIKPLVPDSVPQATLLKLTYEQQKLEVQRDLHKQELRAHGLNDEQIEQVAEGRVILKELIVYAPKPIGKAASGMSVPVGEQLPRSSGPSPNDSETVYTVASVAAYRGQIVNRGDQLGMLADHGRLLVRGHAFEKESDAVERALIEQWPISVEFVVGERTPLTRDDMEILYTENIIASGSRTMEFFLDLNNDIVARRKGADGNDYISWRFKPGQQARLFVPVRKWTDVIVLPTEAVTEEGPDAYAFSVSGKELERRAVHVLYRDARSVVVEDNGSFFPGEQVALNNAYQLNLALKKQQGGGADPHAGHMH